MSDYPSVRPSLNLNFARTKKLDPRVTFRRASTGTYVDADGLIKTAGINVPRFDHDPVTGVCKGLLVEEARTNTATYSSDFQSSFWTQVASTILPNVGLAPDGTITGCKIVEDGTNNVHLIRRNTGAAGTYTVSVYAKSAERTCLWLGVRTRTSAFFDLANGSTPTAGAAITAVGNGWYRCSFVATYDGVREMEISPALNTSTNSYTGTAEYGIYVWGAQVEAGSFPTSYIPTAASTVTRSADLASITGTNFSSWYNQSEGTLYADIPTGIAPYASNGTLIGLSAGALSPTMSVGDGFKYGTGSPSTNTRTQYRFNSLVQFDSNLSTNPKKVALAYKTNDFSISRDATIASSKTGSVASSIDQFTILGRASHVISRIAYWPKRLPDAQLQALTRR